MVPLLEAVLGRRGLVKGHFCLGKWKSRLVSFRFTLRLLVVKFDQPNNSIGLASSKEKAAKDAGMVTLKIKRVKCLTGRPANPIQSVPPAGVLGKRKAGDLCVGCVFKHIRTPLRFTQRYMSILALVKKPNQVPNLR